MPLRPACHLHSRRFDTVQRDEIFSYVERAFLTVVQQVELSLTAREEQLSVWAGIFPLPADRKIGGCIRPA